MASAKGLCDTEYTLDWVVARLRDSIGVTELDTKVVSHEAERIGVGQGFLSHIVRVKFVWAGDKKDEMPSAVILKIPTVDTLKGHIENIDFSQTEGITKEEMIEQMETTFLPMAHGNECKVYELWAHDSPVLMPKVYFSKAVGSLRDGGASILMQDFSTMGSVTPNGADGLNLEQVHAIFDNIAAMHAWSFKNKGKFEDQFAIMPKDEFEKWPATFKAVSKQLIELDSKLFTEELFDSVIWACDPDYVYSVQMKYKEEYYGVPAVFVHGDLWTNNTLFNETTGKLMALIDFQVAHAGNCAEDMCRVLFSSVVGDLRRKETDNLLKFYHDRLTEKLAPMKPPISLEDVKRSFAIAAPFSVFFYLFSVPIMTNSAVVEGPTKEQRIREMLVRAEMGIRDVMQHKQAVQDLVAKIKK